MKWNKNIFFILLLLPGLLNAEENSKDYAIHVVQPNDTLSGIAFRYCRKVYGSPGLMEHIKKINPGLTADIYPGMQIRIPLDKKLCHLQHSEISAPKEEVLGATEREKKVLSMTVPETEVVSSPVPVTESQNTVVPEEQPAEMPQPPLVNELKEVEKEKSERWVVSFGSGSKTIKSIDDDNETAIINSQNFVTMGIGQEIEWTSHHHSKIHFNLSYEDYFENEAKVKNPAPWRWGIGLKHEYQPKDLIFFTELALTRKTVFLSSNAQKVNLGVLPVPSFGGGLEFPLYAFSKYKFTSGLELHMLLPARDDEVRLRPGFESQAYLHLDTGNGTWNLYYTYGRQDSNLYESNYDVIGLSFEFSFSGGG